MNPDVQAGWRFRCPVCHTALLSQGDDRLVCDGQQHAFQRIDGVWRLLPQSRAEAFAAFIRDYETVRELEGRSSADAAYYRALPFRDLTDRFTADWRIRAISFRALVEWVVKPLEVRLGRPLLILDLGAGNGWLSHRLAERGHTVAAIDLLTNPADGLGAHRNYHTAFTPIQAEFDHLPLGSLQADLAVFNGSVHYSTDLESTLRETLRVLRPDGVLVILDSPVYRDPASGDTMVRDREAHFTSEFGFPSNALPMENYLTFQRLNQIASRIGVRWEIREPYYGVSWALRPWKARIRRRREPARFVLAIGYQSSARLDRRRSIKRRLWRTWLRLTRPVKARAQDRVVIEQVAGRDIIVLPEVFNPRLLRSGAFFASRLDERLVPPGSRVLDLGTGSGIAAIVAARWAGEVTAVDINPLAVRCARINALLNHVDQRVIVRHGDLFNPVRDEHFDLILFNPPFYRGTPRNLNDVAWRSEDVVARFASELKRHLTDDGSALVILSTDGEELRFLDQFADNNLNVEAIARHDLTNEVFTIYRLTDRSRTHDDHSV